MVQSGRESLSVTVTDEFCTFDLINLELKFFLFFFFVALYPARREGIISPRNLIALLKNGKMSEDGMRSNSDFMILNASMSMSRNVYISNNINS